MGIGGDDSWSPCVHDKYLVRAVDYSFSVRLSPVTAATSGHSIYKSQLQKKWNIHLTLWPHNFCLLSCYLCCMVHSCVFLSGATFSTTNLKCGSRVIRYNMNYIVVVLVYFCLMFMEDEISCMPFSLVLEWLFSLLPWCKCILHVNGFFRSLLKNVAVVLFLFLDHLGFFETWLLRLIRRH